MPDAPSSVHVDLQIDVSPRRAFEAWVDPLEIARWFVGRAEGDPRSDKQVTWVLSGEERSFEVVHCEPYQRIVLRDIGPAPWNGSVLSVAFEEDADTHTIVTVRQRGFRPQVRDQIAQIGSLWACRLALLKEYLENHMGMHRDQIEVSSEIEANPPAVRTALRSLADIEGWAGEEPEQVLAATPYAAVLRFHDLPGVFTVTGGNDISVWYTVWGGSDAQGAHERAQQLIDRFSERVQALSRKAGG